MGGARTLLQAARPSPEKYGRVHRRGETVMLMTPTSSSPLERLLKGRGGCSRMAVSPTARPASAARRVPSSTAISVALRLDALRTIPSRTRPFGARADRWFTALQALQAVMNIRDVTVLVQRAALEFEVIRAVVWRDSPCVVGGGSPAPGRLRQRGRLLRPVPTAAGRLVNRGSTIDGAPSSL